MKSLKEDKKRKQEELDSLEDAEPFQKKCKAVAKSSTERSRKRRAGMSPTRKQAERKTTTIRNVAAYHAMDQERKQVYIDSNTERVMASYNAMDPEDKKKLNAEKAKSSRDNYRTLESDCKATLVEANRDSRKKRETSIDSAQKNMFQEAEAQRKSNARKGSEDSPLQSACSQFWAMRSSAELEPSLNPGKKYSFILIVAHV